MSRWDAARAASRRPLRKYKPCGPVGPSLLLLCPDIKLKPGLNRNGRQMTGDETCFDCGRHLCSCKPRQIVGVDRGVDDRGTIIHGTYADGKLTINRVEEHKPVSRCWRSLAVDREYHTEDCGKLPCALAVKP